MTLLLGQLIARDTCARFGYPAGADTQAAELARAAGVPATSATVALGAACRAVGHSRP
jgi:hypothetical protein